MQEEVLFPAADGQLWDFVSGGASAQTLLLSFTLPTMEEGAPYNSQEEALGTEEDEAGRRAGVG